MTVEYPFSALSLLLRWQEGHTACNQSCFNNSQKFTSGTGLTWSNSRKVGRFKQKPKAAAATADFEQEHAVQVRWTIDK